MEYHDGVFHIGPFVAVTIGIITLFVGKRLNDRFGFLREYSIPEPVTGGLLVTVLIGLIHAVTGVEVEFKLQARDILLVYFFTTIGINANLREIGRGGRPLAILMAICVGFMLLQNVTGIAIAGLFGFPKSVGLIGGTVSLIGGHGTAIAWGDSIARDQGISNAVEIGIACATIGLILASILGGPLARFLIKRHGLASTDERPPLVGLPEKQETETIDYVSFLAAVLALHICIIIGIALNELLSRVGFHIPRFATCLVTGLIFSSIIPRNFPAFPGGNWPSRTPSMALIAEITLGAFLAMSLMSLQVWTLVELAGPILALLVAQLLLTVFVTVFILFPSLGRNYDAAVISAGFAGFSLGSTPTAMANMTAITRHNGASTLAFIVVPLTCAFFIDLVNAVLIPMFLKMV